MKQALKTIGLILAVLIILIGTYLFLNYDYFSQEQEPVIVQSSVTIPNGPFTYTIESRAMPINVNHARNPERYDRLVFEHKMRIQERRDETFFR